MMEVVPEKLQWYVTGLDAAKHSEGRSLGYSSLISIVPVIHLGQIMFSTHNDKFFFDNLYLFPVPLDVHAWC